MTKGEQRGWRERMRTLIQSKLDVVGALPDKWQLIANELNHTKEAMEGRSHVWTPANVARVMAFGENTTYNRAPETTYNTQVMPRLKLLKLIRKARKEHNTWAAVAKSLADQGVLYTNKQGEKVLWDNAKLSAYFSHYGKPLGMDKGLLPLVDSPRKIKVVVKPTKPAPAQAQIPFEATTVTTAPGVTATPLNFGSITVGNPAKDDEDVMVVRFNGTELRRAVTRPAPGKVSVQLSYTGPEDGDIAKRILSIQPTM